MTVYRFMRRGSMDLNVLVEELLTEEEAETPPDGRERRFPALRQARSVWRPKRLAWKRWEKGRLGAAQRREEPEHKFMAEIRLTSGKGYFCEEIGKDGHVSLWGDTTNLAKAVVRVYAETSETEEE